MPIYEAGTGDKKKAVKFKNFQNIELSVIKEKKDLLHIKNVRLEEIPSTEFFLDEFK